MEAVFCAESESGIRNCVRGFAGDRQGLKDGLMVVGRSETAHLELLLGGKPALRCHDRM
jgi:hypothetical protein